MKLDKNRKKTDGTGHYVKLKLSPRSSTDGETKCQDDLFPALEFVANIDFKSGTYTKNQAFEKMNASINKSSSGDAESPFGIVSNVATKLSNSIESLHDSGWQFPVVSESDIEPIKQLLERLAKKDKIRKRDLRLSEKLFKKYVEGERDEDTTVELWWLVLAIRILALSKGIQVILEKKEIIFPISTFYELLVGGVLSRHLDCEKCEISYQETVSFMDYGPIKGHLKIRPDFVCRCGNKTLIVDAKYSRHWPYIRTSFYQMQSYMATIDSCTNGVLCSIGVLCSNGDESEKFGTYHHSRDDYSKNSIDVVEFRCGEPDNLIEVIKKFKKSIDDTESTPSGEKRKGSD